MAQALLHCCMGLPSHLFHIDRGGPSYLHTRLSFKATVRKCAAVDFLCLGPKSVFSPIRRQLLSSVSVNLPWPHWRYPPFSHLLRLSFLLLSLYGHFSHICPTFPSPTHNKASPALLLPTFSPICRVQLPAFPFGFSLSLQGSAYISAL